MHKTLLITGASSGIGEATALALADRFRLALVARRADRLEALAGKVRASGGEAFAIAEDIAADGAAGRIVERARERFGGLDALVNNAGIFETAPVELLSADHVDRVLGIDLRAPILLTAAALPHLRARRGMVVNVSSMAVDAAFAGCAVYTAAKAGLEAFSRVVREEERAAGVRVTVVAPGATDTAAWPDGPRAQQAHRMCRPQDVAAAIRLALEAPPTASYDRIVVAPPGGAL